MATKMSVGKLIPSSIVLAVAGFCTWSTLSDPDPGGKETKGKLPEVTLTMLSPTITPAPERDPFKSPGEAQPSVLAKLRIKEPTTGPNARPVAGSQGGGSFPAQNDRIARVVEALGDALTLQRGTFPLSTAKAVPKVNLAELLARLDLNATSVRGADRVAVINGRIYRQGEALEGTPNVLLAQVLPGRVRLECQGDRAELSFPEIHGSTPTPNSLPTAPRPAPKPARRGGGGRTPTKPR
jgi:hypothetical protein